MKNGKVYSEAFLEEAYDREMKPEDLERELEDCRLAEQRLAVIDAKKLEELRNTPVEAEEAVSF